MNTENSPILYLCNEGTWCERRSDFDFSGRPALFLDRDGVVVEEVRYLREAADVRLIRDIAQGIRAANAMGIPVVMVTNQSGIGRGLFTWQDFAAVQDRLLGDLAQSGASFDMVLACAYHRDGNGTLKVDAHEWRKPRPGMLLEAGRRLGVDLARSLIVGDTLADMQAGFNAGLPSGTMVLTGHGRREVDEHRMSLIEFAANGFRVDITDHAGAAIAAWLSAGHQGSRTAG